MIQEFQVIDYIGSLNGAFYIHEYQKQQNILIASYTATNLKAIPITAIAMSYKWLPLILFYMYFYDS